MSSFLALLTLAALAVNASGQCVGAGTNCWDSMCCQDPKALCHAKKEGYALCLRNCTKGIHLGEPKNDSYWECNVLAKCSWGQESGENCMIKGCCMVPGESCFTKVGGYGQCRKKCPKGWNCTKVTEAKPYLAFPCAKEFKQCGGNGFKGNPCCADGLVCHGDQPKFYQQCTNKDDVKRLKKKAAKKSVATPGSKKKAQVPAPTLMMTTMTTLVTSGSPMCRTTLTPSRMHMQSFPGFTFWVLHSWWLLVPLPSQPESRRAKEGPGTSS